MSTRVIEQSIEIQAPAAQVWRVFVEPALTRQMGGEYICDWKPGSPFGWQALNGQQLTHGTLLKFEPERLLAHTLHAPGSTGRDGGPLITSVIRYELREAEGRTTLLAREQLAEALSDEAYAGAVEGWQAALQAVKSIAEQ
jgi:uncharacterized protein YndB with AHSA1/START domain